MNDNKINNNDQAIPQYTYYVEDGQFSFQVNIDKLLGEVGETIHISPDGIDEDNDVIINSIEGCIVCCSGTIQDPIK